MPTPLPVMSRSYNPAGALRRQRFGLFPVRSPLLGESFIYFLDYVQYMDELKGQQNFDNPTKEDGQKWKKLLEENAKYHKTLHFDNDNVKN